MKRFCAKPPESIAELCLVRLGFEARGVSGLLYLARLGGRIDRSAADATEAGSGLLRSERFRLGFSKFGYLQYWKSFDSLEAWTRTSPHVDWWREAAERIRTRGDISIYHEAYLVDRNRCESIYLNTGSERAGLASFGDLSEPVGAATTARDRLGRREPRATPSFDDGAERK